MALFSGTWSSSGLREPGQESCSSDDEWTSWSLSSIATGATVHSAISNHKGAHKHKHTHPHTHTYVLWGVKMEWKGKIPKFKMGKQERKSVYREDRWRKKNEVINKDQNKNVQTWKISQDLTRLQNRFELGLSNEKHNINTDVIKSFRVSWPILVRFCSLFQATPWNTADGSCRSDHPCLD